MSLMLIRKQRHLTAEAVSERLGISRAHYTHLENGTRSFTEELIIKLAKILEVSPEVIRSEAEDLKLNNLIPNSWVSKIKINGKPLIKAFIEHVKDSERYNYLSQDELTERLIKFIFFHIEHSLRQELKENKEVVQFISRKLGHNKTQP